MNSILMTVDAASGNTRSMPGSIGPREAAFITERDSFHLASITNSGWPWPSTQYHKGPKGFLRTVDNKTLALAAPQTSILTGSVLLFLMDHASQIRLKIWAQIRISESAMSNEFYRAIHDTAVDPTFLFHVQRFDWSMGLYSVPAVLNNNFDGSRTTSKNLSPGRGRKDSLASSTAKSHRCVMANC